MDADGLPLIGSGIDLSKVEPISHKRSLAMINHFIMHTVGFLNRFSSICEEKLEEMSQRIDRLSTTMILLEAKLSSIPGLDDITVATSSAQPPITSQNQVPQQQQQQQRDELKPSTVEVNGTTVNGVSSSTTDPSLSTTNVPNVDTNVDDGAVAAINDSRYAKYFTLLKHGVPKGALIPKMKMEGLDPDILDNPNAPVTQAQAPANSTENKNDEDDADLSDSDIKSDSLSDNEMTDSDLDD